MCIFIFMQFLLGLQRSVAQLFTLAQPWLSVRLDPTSAEWIFHKMLYFVELFENFVNMFRILTVKVKVKFTLRQGTNSQRGSRDIVLLFLNLLATDFFLQNLAHPVFKM